MSVVLLLIGGSRGTARRALMLAGWLLLCCTSPAPGSAQEVLEVRYPRHEASVDARNDYFLQVLDLALEKAGEPYRLQPAPVAMTQARAMRQLRHGRTVDVMWTMTTADREAALRPIRIPLQNGLIGTRLLLIRRADRERFRSIRSADALRRLTAGQGHDWPDTRILSHNGFDVLESSSYAGLFGMLKEHRIDYFPRSMLEIWSEADQYAADGFVIEDGLALTYPAAVYFFVHPSNTRLAERIERGLRRAQADGSFEALFERHFGDFVQRARLGERVRLKLDNPLVSAGYEPGADGAGGKR